MIEGIDVSHWQGYIDWRKVAAAGKRFAIIASGDGAWLDPTFERNIEWALAVGLDVSIYHYIRFSLLAERQAEICRQRWEEAVSRGFQPVAMPLTGGETAGLFWLDFEDVDSPATPAFRRGWADILLDDLDGLPLGWYTGTWWMPRMNPYPRAGTLPLWIGQYPGLGCLSDPTQAGWAPILPPEWNDWAVWQYTSSGRVDGIDGNVDLNIFDLDYWGQGGDEMIDLTQLALALKALGDAESPDVDAIAGIAALARMGMNGTGDTLTARIAEVVRAEIASQPGVNSTALREAIAGLQNRLESMCRAGLGQ